MTRHIVLDSSPLSALCLPPKNPGLIAIMQWATSCVGAGHRLYIPEVIDYELRRELLRAAKTESTVRLDNLTAVFRYLPLTSAAIRHAADLWAQGRRSGIPTGDPKKLDIDVILAAQALTLTVPANDIIVATSNVAHISRFVAADEWRNIHP